MNQFSGRPVEILLIEDNAGDVVLTQRAFRKAKIHNNIQVSYDGEMALAMLRKQGDFSNAPTPDIIFLDLNLPKLDGHEVLATIKQDPVLKHIPVVILTSSTMEKDVKESYNLHANCYVTKPLDLAQFLKVISMLEDFWFTVVLLPKNE